MKFSRRKLPKEAVASLRRIPVAVCGAYAILLTPVYVFLPKNQKFVAVKAPLQYFSPEEQEKMKPFESFYISEFIDQVAPFYRAGEAIRELLKVRQRVSIPSSQGRVRAIMPMPSHELSDAVSRSLADLWGATVKVEPFFLCFFADAVCDPFPTDTILKCAEANIDLFELAYLRASAAVFLALHLGYTDAHTLSILRERVFADTEFGRAPDASAPGSLQQLGQLVKLAIPDADTREISLTGLRELLRTHPTLTHGSLKLFSRLERLRLSIIKPEAASASIYGEKGFCDE